MCGIVGYIDPNTSPAARAEAVARMCAALSHRGPDDAGVAARGAATLGARRLAIFDPAHGHQPLRSPDGRFLLVFNGAIYNFRALRHELAAAGFPFRTECDTEVLLAAFAHWGERCLDRLRGMFAFAVWDAQENTLFLARDPFGIKPLYFRHAGPQLLFASELNALLASGHCAAELDPAAVSDYLAWLAVPAPRTIYRDVVSLRPGECATFRDGQLSIRRAWSFQTHARSATPCRSPEEFTHELRARLEDTIRVHCLADVPVGAFLSGGLDSALVVGLMTRATASRLRTFSIAFDEAGYSEAREAEETARHCGTLHTTRVVTGAEIARDVETLIDSLDQPTGDGINTYYASAAARAGGVKVALSGLGGDELFGGYPSFRDIPRFARWLPLWRAMPSPARRLVTRRLSRGDTRQRKLADVLGHARDLHQLGALQRRVFSETTRRSLLAPPVRAAGAAPFHPELAALSRDVPASDPFAIASAWELRTYMADVLLRDSDVMSMRHSLELRVPFIDRELIAWLWTQPTAYKADRAHPKAPLFAAVRDIVPPGFAARRKHGFTLPFAVWMKCELRPFLSEVFSETSIDRSGLFSRPAVQQLWTGFLSGNDSREWSRVWSLAVLIAFANRRAPQPTAAKISPTIESESVAREIAPRQTGPSDSASASRSLVRGEASPGRTLLLAPEIFASEGGIPRILQIYLRALCDLSRAPDSVRLLALNDAHLDADDLRRCGNGTIGDWRVCNRDKLLFVAAALKMSRNCDRLVCGHVAQLPVAWLARRANPQLRYYLIAHGIEVWRPFNAAERLALRGAERIFCVSDYTRRELLRHCPLPEGRAIVLHNALDPTFTIGPGRALGTCPPVILTVTRLTWDDRYKGVEHLIAALPAIRAAIPGAQLRVVGRGDDLPRLREVASRAGVTDAVVFTGHVDDARLSEEIRSCRLFALPSRKEGFGLVFIEAMAHGRPCLGARAGGIPEVISSDSGVLVDYGDVPGIAAAAIRALQHDWRETDILACARRFAYPEFKHQLAHLLAA